MEQAERGEDKEVRDKAMLEAALNATGIRVDGVDFPEVFGFESALGIYPLRQRSKKPYHSHRRAGEGISA